MDLGLTARGKGHLPLRRGESIPGSPSTKGLEFVRPRRAESINGRPYIKGDMGGRANNAPVPESNGWRLLGIAGEFVRAPRQIIPLATSLLLGNNGCALS